MHSVYILYFEKLNRFYIGSSSDLNERLIFHMAADANKFTGKAKDWVVFLDFPCESKNLALKIERHLKSMKSRIYLQNLKKNPDMILKLKKEYSDS